MVAACSTDVRALRHAGNRPSFCEVRASPDLPASERQGDVSSWHQCGLHHRQVLNVREHPSHSVVALSLSCMTGGSRRELALTRPVIVTDPTRTLARSFGPRRSMSVAIMRVVATMQTTRSNFAPLYASPARRFQRAAATVQLVRQHAISLTGRARKAQSPLLRFT